MWHGARVAVIVPAYCEARLVGRTIEAVPAFVDVIVVVDDASPDDTSAAVVARGDVRVRLERHSENLGVGAAIVTGYRCALESGADVMAVMAGDAQMDPADLEAVLRPIVLGRADYVKGNRFVHREAHRMPLSRRVGSKLLSQLTRWSFGLDVDDTQCGYTAISAPMARRVPFDELWPRYGYPNDLLGILGSLDAKLAEVPVRPVYGNESSGLRPWHVALIAGLVMRRAVKNRIAGQRSANAAATRAASWSPRPVVPLPEGSRQTTPTRGARGRSARP